MDTMIAGRDCARGTLKRAAANALARADESCPYCFVESTEG
jgi:hypothetical protein